MIYRREWTGQRVIDRLVAVFERLGETQFYPPATKDYAAKPIDGLDLISATAICLGRDAHQRIVLLTLARAKGRRESIRGLCANFGWVRSTAYRHRDRAAEHVAYCLNTRSDLGRISPLSE